MHEQFKAAFDGIEATERLKRQTKAHVRRKTFDYGRQIQRVRARHRRLAASLASLVLLLTGLGAWFTPTTSIGVDINPSLELQVNIFDRVISLKGRNLDGEAVAGELDLTGKPYDEAMQRILISEELEPYLESGNMISISVIGGGSDVHAEKILSKVVCRAYAIAEDENVFYCQTDKGTLAAARESGLCIPRYLAWQHLLEQDPNVTAEAVAQMPKDEIRALAQREIIENPCGE